MIPGIPVFLDRGTPPTGAYRPCKVQPVAGEGTEAVLGPQRYLFHRTEPGAILAILRDKQLTATPRQDEPGEAVSFSTTLYNPFPNPSYPMLVFNADRLYAMNDTLGPLCYVSGEAMAEAFGTARKNPRFAAFLKEQMALRGAKRYAPHIAVKTVFKTYDVQFAHEYEWIANSPVRFTRDAVVGVVSTFGLRTSSYPYTRVLTTFSEWKRTLTRILTEWVTARAFPTAWAAVITVSPRWESVPQGMPEAFQMDVPLLLPPDPYWYWARVVRVAMAHEKVAPPLEYRESGYASYFLKMPPERWARVADAIDPLSELPFSELAPRFLGVAEINRIRYDISHGAVRP